MRPKDYVIPVFCFLSFWEIDTTEIEISISSQPQASGYEHAETVPAPHSVTAGHSPRDTGNRDAPVMTRPGRTVVQPQRCKDCVLSCR